MPISTDACKNIMMSNMTADRQAPHPFYTLSLSNAVSMTLRNSKQAILNTNHNTGCSSSQQYRSLTMQ